MNIQIKNMVCPRCVSSVRGILNDLGIEFSNLELGRVEVISKLSASQQNKLQQKLKAQGFELLKGEEESMINVIKSIIINQVHYSDNTSDLNLSELLSKKLLTSYSKLSKTFSKQEGVTIEQYLLQQRIEKVKELLSYDEKTISEIAFESGYSSTAHLSNQFKKITGMTPSKFRKLNNRSRKPLDDI